MAAKGAREKIRLVLPQKQVISTQQQKTNVICLKKWKSKNLIRLCVNTLFIKKQKSNNFARIEKPDIVRVFCILRMLEEDNAGTTRSRNRAAWCEPLFKRLCY